MKHSLNPLLASLALGSPGFAQVVESGAFEGSLRENFNAFAQLTQATCLPSAFADRADICSSVPNDLWVPLAIGDGDCQVNAPWFLAAFNGIVSVSFHEPVHRFGGELVTIDPTQVAVRFFDDNDVLIDSHAADASPFCVFQWNGWESLGTGITRVEIDAGGHEVALERLEADPRLGARTCVSIPNSTGSAAHVFAFGTASVTANDMHLSAGPVPEGAGVFVYGPAPDQVPFGNGFLCVGAPLSRLAAPPVSGQTLTASFDNTVPTATQTQITAGSTWWFQAVFRDGGGPNALGLSDAVRVTFEP